MSVVYFIRHRVEWDCTGDHKFGRYTHHGCRCCIQKVRFLALPPGGLNREAAASAADRTVWAWCTLCTRLELSLFFIRDRFLDKWLFRSSSTGVDSRVASGTVSVDCSYRVSMTDAHPRASLRGCIAVVVNILVGVLKVFHTIIFYCIMY